MGLVVTEIKRVLVHIRFPLQAFTLLGFSFGLMVLSIPLSSKLIVALFSWFLVASGVTVFNSYYDKDDEPVAGLANPPKTHKSMLFGSWFLKIAGIGMSLSVNSLFTILCCVFVFLSVLYSHKTFRFKSNGYVAIIFNFVAGAMTFFAVFSISQTPFSYQTILGILTAGFFLASVYVMMQIHQVEADERRGDFSFASVHGTKDAITLAGGLMLLAILCGAVLIYVALSITVLFAMTVFMGIVLSRLLAWRKREVGGDDKITHYKTMSKLTNFLALWGNILMLGIYFIENGL